MAQAVQRGLVTDSPDAPFRTVVTSAFSKRFVQFVSPKFQIASSSFVRFGGLGRSGRAGGALSYLREE